MATVLRPPGTRPERPKRGEEVLTPSPRLNSVFLRIPRSASSPLRFDACFRKIALGSNLCGDAVGVLLDVASAYRIGIFGRSEHHHNKEGVMSNLSRRNFITGGAIAALGGTLAIAGCAPKGESSSTVAGAAGEGAKA